MLGKCASVLLGSVTGRCGQAVYLNSITVKIPQSRIFQVMLSGRQTARIVTILAGHNEIYFFRNVRYNYSGSL